MKASDIRMKANDIRGTVITSDKESHVVDNNELEGMTVSTTRIKAYKATKGYTRSVGEVYHFIAGSGLMYQDGVATFVCDDDIVLVHKGVHGYITAGPYGLSLVCVFNGQREALKQDPRTLPGYTESF